MKNLSKEIDDDIKRRAWIRLSVKLSNSEWHDLFKTIDWYIWTQLLNPIKAEIKIKLTIK